jgi:hypothetical protein
VFIIIRMYAALLRKIVPVVMLLNCNPWVIALSGCHVEVLCGVI